jgi:hypothetical protein
MISAMISAMDPLPPEALLEDYPPPMQAIANRLRRILKATVPDAIERVRPGWRLIGYDVPLGRRTAYFGYIAPENEHVHLGFEHGTAMDDPNRLLQGEGITRQVRWLTFRDGDPIDERACAELIHEAVRVATMPRGERALRTMSAAEEDR